MGKRLGVPLLPRLVAVGGLDAEWLVSIWRPNERIVAGSSKIYSVSWKNYAFFTVFPNCPKIGDNMGYAVVTSGALFGQLVHLNILG